MWALRCLSVLVGVVRRLRNGISQKTPTVPRATMVNKRVQDPDEPWRELHGHIDLGLWEIRERRLEVGIIVSALLERSSSVFVDHRVIILTWDHNVQNEKSQEVR